MTWTDPENSAKSTGESEGLPEQAGLGWVSLDHGLCQEQGRAGVQNQGQLPASPVWLAGDDHSLDAPQFKLAQPGKTGERNLSLERPRLGRQIPIFVEVAHPHPCQCPLSLMKPGISRHYGLDTQSSWAQDDPYFQGHPH